MSTNSNSFKIIHYKSLTGIRAIAAIMIFVYHNRKYWKNELNPELFRFCSELNLGVQLFFVLSGFLIAKSYGSRPLESVSNYKRYLLQRMVRIMPLYWLLLTLYYLDPDYGKYHFSVTHYLLIQGFSSTHFLDAISQSWSLTVEMTFYTTAPLLMFFWKKHFSYLLMFLMAIMGITLLVGWFWDCILGNSNHYLEPYNFVFMTTFAGQSFWFASGMSLVLYPNFWNTISRSKHTTTFAIFGFLGTLYTIGRFQTSRIDHGTNHWQGKLLYVTVLPLCILILIQGLMTQRSLWQRFLSSRIMIVLGKASFAFYLIHISYVNLKLNSWLLLPDRNFILLWLLAIALYYGFEKPIYDWYKKKV